MNKSKFENLKDIQDWAEQYDDFYLFKNNEHNIHFWQVTKAETFKDAEKLLKRNLNWNDIKDSYGGGMQYLDWWDKDCQNAAMSENKPVDWMKKRIMKNKLSSEYFENKESNFQKNSNGNDLKVTEEKDFIETREKKEKPPFSNLPPLLLFIATLLIFQLPSYISSFRTQPTETQWPETQRPETQRPETKLPKTKVPKTKVPKTKSPETKPDKDIKPDKYICEICKIMGNCDLTPECITKQEKCEWKQNWDGTVVKDCKSY